MGSYVIRQTCQAAVGVRSRKNQRKKNQRIENREIKFLKTTSSGLFRMVMTSSGLLKEGVREHGRDGGGF